MDNQDKRSPPCAHGSQEPMTAPTRSAVMLTEKEHQILHWAALGKTTWEISRIQGRTEAAVNFHLCNIRRKFGVNSLRAALMKAIAQGMIV